MWRPFSRTYSVRCPDGSTKQVYRNVDDACPLYIPGMQRESSAKADASAKTAGLGSLKAEVKGKYAKKIEALIFGIDELTQTVMINFRSVYLAFSADPCSNNSFFLRQVEKLVAEQQRIANLRIQASTLIALAKNRPDDTVIILEKFKEVAGGVGGSVALEVVREDAKLEIVEARQLADKWSDQ